MKLNQRSVVTLVSACAVSLASLACSGTPSDTGAEGENPAETALDKEGPKVDPASALEAMRAASAHPDVGVLDSAGGASVDEIVGDEKIRNGTVINYNDTIGRSTVLLISPVTLGVCTGQIINKWFILTAAHCIDQLVPGGVNNLIVAFTNQAGSLVTTFSGQVAGSKPSNAQPHDRDIGIILVGGSGMNTCQLPLSNCASGSPNIPVNPVFQYFRPNLTPVVGTGTYPIVGYGSVDDAQNGLAVLRKGTMNVGAAGFTDTAKTNFTFIMSWTANSQPRACHGDSGGPMLALGGNRLLYTGITSSLFPPGSVTCNSSTGNVTYTGVTEDMALWALNLILGVRNAAGLGFDCTAATSGNLSMFACDNDGSQY